MDGIKVQEESIYLPEDIVRKSTGFTVDVGRSARIHSLALTHTHTEDVGKSARIHSLAHAHTHTYTHAPAHCGCGKSAWHHWRTPTYTSIVNIHKFLSFSVVTLSDFLFFCLGSSLIKVVYRSIMDFKGGQPINKDVRFILLPFHTERQVKMIHYMQNIWLSLGHG